MQKLPKAIITIAILILCIAVAVNAQADCSVDSEAIMEVVENVCDALGDNEVCYGNFEVSAIAQDNSPSFVFEEAGDLASLGFVRSLFLSALDPETDTWGIAQMRLIANTSNGTQNIDMLLFGNVEVTNNVPPTTEIDVLVGRYAANIRNSPSSNALILASAPSGAILHAVGRLEDNSWIRVLIEGTDAVGWVSASLIGPANESESFDDLAIQDSSSPYFGAMQAMYFTDNGGSGCGNITSDGLLIQTPQGTARVTLLINEVSIELIPSENGATALITGNSEDGMTVAVIDGTANVETGGAGYFVNAGQETSVPLNPDLSPSGTPSLPDEFDTAVMIQLPVLPIFRDPSRPIAPIGSGVSSGGGSGNGGGNNGGGGNGNGNGNANGNANGRGNGNGNAQGNRNGN